MCVCTCFSYVCFDFFFFFKQKTAYEMRISDWSSDVCSSDLQIAPEGPICSDLREAGALLSAAPFKHSYPHSWRSKAKVIYRCTPQWFIGMDRPIVPENPPRHGEGDHAQHGGGATLRDQIGRAHV